MTGRLEIITGPMFAGKTTELLKRLVVLKKAGLKVLYMNHLGDTRILDYKFSTHALDIVDWSNTINVISIDSLPSPATLTMYDVVAFDETHWYQDLSVIDEYV